MLGKAIDLDDGSDPEVSKSLRWLSEVTRTVTASHPKLLHEEKQALLKTINERIAGNDENEPF